MRIALIGSGNTATVLGRMMKQAGHIVTGVYSKTTGHAARLADELNAQYSNDIKTITAYAQLCIIAVSDGAIAEIASAITLPGKIVVHTSGAVSKNVLAGMSENYGVLYPLQSLRKEAQHLPIIPLLIDGSDDITKQQVKQLAQSISPMVEEAGDEKRLKLHLAAVMASNFTNHLYSLTEDFCNKEGIPFKAVVPLIEEVAQRTASYQPTLMQTGPAIRGDRQTIEKHMQLLSSYPLQQDVYRAMTESITKFYGNS